ncbi:MAG: SDR family oxidoreductase, partial [Bacteroidales bacterium]|nr:SDR family oxidoreductase [Bacteroidales bacterium]
MAYNLLKGKKGIIFGALDNKSIAWKVAERAHDEGAVFTLSNTPTALRFGELDELAAKCNSEIIAADATSVKDITHVFEKSQEILGGKIDFVLHSIGMSLNVRKKRVYNDLNYEYLNKTLDISAISFHKMLQIAFKMDAINEWGSVVALSYVAAQRTLYGYNDMADAKALLESIARSFG